MKEEFITKINMNILELMKGLNKGSEFEKYKWDDSEGDILNKLEELAIQWENKIDAEHKKSYVTDEVENKFKGITTQCMEAISDGFEELSSKYEKQLKKLLKHRHFGYGFFKLYDKSDLKDQKGLEKIRLDDVYGKILYLSLIEYFQKFFGRFYDNEEAIKMICHNYSNKFNFNEKEQEKIASAFHHHIKTAGTPGDIGYAYDGISKLIQYIHNLPVEIIEKTLGFYKRNEVCYHKEYRHQIYTAIHYMKADESLKRKYKFFFIDSVMILKVFQTLIIKNESNFIIQNFDDNFGIMEAEIQLFTERDTGLVLYLVSEKACARLIKSKKETLAGIKIDENIKIAYRANQMEWKFDENDWMLNCYENHEFFDQLQKDLFDKPNEESGKRKDGFAFSYVYLDGFRGLEKQSLSFDHKYKYLEKEIKVDKDYSTGVRGIYGEQIESVSCIVGKNGTGKTSIVDFLSEYFFIMISMLDDSAGSQTNKTIEEEIQEYLNEMRFGQDFKMLVIFQFDHKDYFLTNIGEIKYEQNNIMEYERGLLSFNNDSSKIIYFSNKMDVHTIVARDLDYEMSNFNTEEDNKTINKIKTLRNIKKVDYSEMLDLKEQQLMLQIKSKSQQSKESSDNSQSERTVYNKTLCYQLCFLCYYSNEKLKEILWDEFDKEKLEISEPEFAEIFQKIIKTQGEDFKQIIKSEQFKKLITCYAVVINHFSSGQYAKFSFLSKLFWCLKGNQEFAYQISDAVKDHNIFDDKNTIKPGDSAVLFIDEGEVYYHPEWQRRYIQTLTEMIQEHRVDSKLQIIITTNSPFILSDFFGGNITYLPGNDKNELTFGQNIHTLLKQNFFMEGTIGSFSEKVIKELFSALSNREKMTYKDLSEIMNQKLNLQTTAEKVYETVEYLIELIGEEVYRTKLLQMLEGIKTDESNQEKYLEDEIKRLTEQLRLIQSRGDNDDTDETVQ